MGYIVTDYLRNRIARATWISHRDRQLAQLGMKPSEYANDLPIPDWAYAMADAVIRELDRDYILVPKSHTLARVGKKPLFRGHWADAGPPIGLYPTRLPVHSHGPEEGAGMACRERWVDGRLIGACLPDAANFTSEGRHD